MFLVVRVFIIIAILSLRWIHPTISLFMLVVLGVLGMYSSRFPLIEYLLILTLTLFICFFLFPRAQYIIALPGTAVGYFWRCFFSNIGTMQPVGGDNIVCSDRLLLAEKLSCKLVHI